MLRLTNIALKTGAVTASTLLSYGLFVALQHVTAPSIEVMTKDGKLNFEELLALVPELIVQSKNLTDLLQTVADNIAVENPEISIQDLMDKKRVPQDPETLMRVRQRQALAPRREARSVSLVDDGFGELVLQTTTPAPTTAPPPLDISSAEIPDLRPNVGGGLAVPGLPPIPMGGGVAGGSMTSNGGGAGGDQPATTSTKTDPGAEQDDDDRIVDELFDFGSGNDTADYEDFESLVNQENPCNTTQGNCSEYVRPYRQKEMLDLPKDPGHSLKSGGTQEASDFPSDKKSAEVEDDDNGDGYVGNDEEDEDPDDYEDVVLEAEDDYEDEDEDVVDEDNVDEYEDVVKEDASTRSEKVEESANRVDDALGLESGTDSATGRQSQEAAVDPSFTASGLGRSLGEPEVPLAFNFSVLKELHALTPEVWNYMYEHGLFDRDLNLTLEERFDLAAHTFRRGRRDAKLLQLSSGDAATVASKRTDTHSNDMTNSTWLKPDTSDNLATIIKKSRELREQLQKMYEDLRQQQDRAEDMAANPKDAPTSKIEVSTWVILAMALVIAVLTTSFGCISYCTRLCKRCSRSNNDNRAPEAFAMGPVMGPPIVDQPRANPAPVYASIQGRQLPAPPNEAEDRLRRLENLLHPPAYQVAVAAAQPNAGIPAVMGAANLGPTLNVNHRHLVQAGEVQPARGAAGGHAALDGTAV